MEPNKVIRFDDQRCVCKAKFNDGELLKGHAAIFSTKRRSCSCISNAPLRLPDYSLVRGLLFKDTSTEGASTSSNGASNEFGINSMIF